MIFCTFKSFRALRKSIFNQRSRKRALTVNWTGTDQNFQAIHVELRDVRVACYSSIRRTIVSALSYHHRRFLEKGTVSTH